MKHNRLLTLVFLGLYLGACGPIATSVPKRFNPGTEKTGGSEEALGAPGAIGPNESPFMDPLEATPTQPKPVELKTTALAPTDYNKWINDSKKVADSQPSSQQSIELSSKQVSELRRTGETTVVLKNVQEPKDLEATVALNMDPAAVDAENTNVFVLQISATHNYAGEKSKGPLAQKSAQKNAEAEKVFVISIDLNLRTKQNQTYAELMSAVSITAFFESRATETVPGNLKK